MLDFGGRIVDSGQSSFNTKLSYISYNRYSKFVEDILLENVEEYASSHLSFEAVNRQDVRSGGRAFGTVVSSGCMQIVSMGGLAASTTVSAYGGMTVQGRSESAVILSRAGMSVESGGTALGTSVAGGSMAVSAGGLVAGGTVLSGGIAATSMGGSLSGMTVSSGGRLRVFSGGTALGVAFLSGAAVDADVTSGTFISGTNAEGGEMLLSGGTAFGFVISSGGHLRLSSGGAAFGAKVLAGASLSVEDGAVATAAKVGGAKGRIDVAAGGTASGAMLSAGRMIVAGTAVDAAVSSRAVLVVESGGVISGAVVLGSLHVWHSGSANGVRLSGGRIDVAVGGTAFSAAVFSGSLCLRQGTALETDVRGGRMIFWEGAVGLGTTAFSDAFLIVNPGCSAAETTLSGGRLSAGGRLTAVRILAGGSLSMSGEGALASGAAVSGGRMKLESGARAVKTSILDGWQFVKADGIASGTQVLEDGQQIVYAEGSAVKTTVSSGGLLTGKEGACLSCTTLKSGAEMSLASGNVLEGSNAFTGAFVRGGTSSRPVRLAKGASLAVGAKTDMSKMHLKAAGAFLTVSGAGNRLGSLALDSAVRVSFDISKLKAKGTTPMLSLSAKNTQKTGAFSVSVGAAQGMGVYELSQNVVQAKNTAWSVRLGSAALGTAKLNGAGFSKNGVSYALTAAKGQICLVLKAKAGKMLKGTSKGESLSGGADSDVFWAGAGNDVIRGSGGRDCAVYGKENWGQDTVAKTSGTLTLVFKGLKAADVTSSLSGTVMTFAKKAAPAQTIAVKGWSQETHSVVFGGAMKSFEAWTKAASPTAAQAKAARQEVWKAAGLAG